MTERLPPEAEARSRDAQLSAFEQFPDQNPNPVLRIDESGTLIYANPASRVLVRDLELAEHHPLPDHLLHLLRATLEGPEGGLAEIEVSGRTFCLKPVASPELGVIHVYGTDVTASRAIERFPEHNPNPVLRVDDDGALLYANAASTPLLEALGLTVGEPMPGELWDRLRATDGPAAGDPVEVKGDGRWYELTCVPIPEMGFVNIYGTDVTAMRALRRFPLQNPNPVLRVSRQGVLLFANPAAEHIVAGFGLEEGSPVPASLMRPIDGDIHGGECSFEIETRGRIYRMTAIAAFEFGFINLYATDITAAKQVEVAHAENERLLLNILPAPIARRLRAGEKVIADRHEDLSLLFADVVGFTKMSSDLEPEQVIDLLDDLFRHLDDLVDRYELEKIKTIGDAYMVVGGLPPHPEDHLARVASMALDLNGILATLSDGHAVKMRIGLHAGPAVAGVIGSKKFIYDVWGDTVNTASRLEAYGVPERIQVTDSVQQRLQDRFIFEPRGTIELKGMGPTHTWFLRGRRRGHASAIGPA